MDVGEMQHDKIPADFALLSDAELLSLKHIKEPDIRDITLSNLIDYVMSLRTELRRREDQLNDKIVNMALGCDQQKKGHFHAGKLLCEGIGRTKDEKQGLKLVENACASDNKSAFLYLVDYHMSHGDRKKVMDLCQKRHEKLQFVEFLIQYPALCESWCEEAITSVISDGYLTNESVSLDSKIVLISLYFQHCSINLAWITGKLPDDGPLLNGIPCLFSKLPESSPINHVSYFIGYGHLFGMKHPRDILKGLEILKSLRTWTARCVNKVIERGLRAIDNAQALAPILPQSFQLKIVLVGDSVGKTSLVRRVTGQPWTQEMAKSVGAKSDIYSLQRFGKNVKLCLLDTAGEKQYRFILPMYLNGIHVCAVCYDSSNNSSSYMDHWCDLVRKTNPEIQIVAVQTKCDAEGTSLLDYCKGHGFKHVRTSARDGIGIDEFIEVCTTSGIIEYVLKHLGSTS